MVVPNHSRFENYGRNVIEFDLDVDEEAFQVLIHPSRPYPVVLPKGAHGPFEECNLRKVFEYDLRSPPVIGHDPLSDHKQTSCSMSSFPLYAILRLRRSLISCMRKLQQSIFETPFFA